MVVDTSALLAYFDSSEPRHQDVAQAIDSEGDALVVSPFVIAEVDYLVGTRVGVDAEIDVLNELSGGAWDLASFDSDDVASAARIIGRYKDQQIGIADASMVVLAARLGTRRMATLDRRHFEVLRPLDGGRFTIVPGAPSRRSGRRSAPRRRA